MSESLSFTLVVPVLLLAVLGMIQVGVWVHARNAAEQAARLAVEESRGARPDLVSARSAALRVSASGGLRDVDVEIERGPDRVRVVVTAAAPTFVDIGLGRISEQASAPVERISRP